MSVVLYESRNHVAIITLNRPDKRNAINDETCNALRDAWRKFASGECIYPERELTAEARRTQSKREIGRASCRERV